MTKRKGIIIIVALVALAYLIILLAIPALADYMAAYGTSGTGGLYNVPVAGYIAPGVIGVLVVIFIARQRKEVKKDDE